MSHRTTFALDDLAIQRLKKLSALLRISQAEVIRRALEKLENEPGDTPRDPAGALDIYHAQGGLDRSTAEMMVAEIDESRNYWRPE
jgi:hypothetical protein